MGPNIRELAKLLQSTVQCPDPDNKPLTPPHTSHTCHESPLIYEDLERAAGRMQSVVECGLKDKKTMPIKYPLPEVVVIQQCLLDDIRAIYPGGGQHQDCDSLQRQGQLRKILG